MQSIDLVKVQQPAQALRFAAHADLAQGGLARWRCACCGAAVDAFLTDGALLAQRPEAAGEYFWAACSDVSCVHAWGEGWGPWGLPAFIALGA